MERLNFHFLVVEFLKHQEQLSQLGIGVEFVSGESYLDDTLKLTRSSFYRHMGLSFSCGRWNLLREFTASDSMGRKWIHRLNPSDNNPVRVMTGGTMNSWLMSSSEMSVEMINFGNQILGMIGEIVTKINSDELSFRMKDQN